MCMTKSLYEGFISKMDISSKRLVNGINMYYKVGNLAMLLNNSHIKCLYHIIKYTCANIVLNNNL